MNENDKVIYTTLDLSEKVNVENIEINIDNIDMTVQGGTVEWMS